MNIADRREFPSCFAGVGAASMRLGGPLPAQEKKSVRLSREMLRNAAGVAGLSFTECELDDMLEGVNQNLAQYEALHKVTGQ